jgi:hypothetical protein
MRAKYHGSLQADNNYDPLHSWYFGSNLFISSLKSLCFCITYSVFHLCEEGEVQRELCYIMIVSVPKIM